MDFDDGCDSLFVAIRPDTEQPVDSAGEVRQVLQEFTRVNETRSRVMMGLRHHAAASDITFIRSVSGFWPMQMGSATSVFPIGARLTRLAMTHAAGDALRLLIENYFMPPLHPDLGERLINQPAPPSDEPAWKNDDEKGNLLGAGFAALDCAALLSEGAFEGSADETAARLLPTKHTDGQRVLEKIAEFVGPHRLSFEITEPGTADFAFTDSYDHYRIVPQGTQIADRLAKAGVAEVAEEMADEFRRLDRAREAVLKLIRAVFAGRDFHYDLDRVKNCWWFGRRYREFSFPIGRTLTLQLLDKSPVLLVQHLLAASRPFEPLPTLEQLKLWVEERCEPATTRGLPEKKPEDWLQPVLWEEIAHDAVTRRAIQIISAARRWAEDDPDGNDFYGDSPLWLLSLLHWYRNQTDVWADDTWWTELAIKAWEQKRSRSAALFLLSRNSAPSEVRAELLSELNGAEGWGEEWINEETLWFLADDLPWPVDTYQEFPKHSLAYGPTPPPLARREAMHCLESLWKAEAPRGESQENWLTALGHLSALDPESAAAWLSADDLQKLRDACLKWAHTSDNTVLLRDAPLSAAAVHGWSEILSVLDRNEAFIAANMAMETQIDWLGEAALKLSRIGRSELAARFAAHVLSGRSGPKPVLQIPGREVHVGKESDPRLLEGSRNEFAAAIAWMRFREKRERST
ncbi:MAG: hypothetical protein QM760_00860 [Nibricoccus sp.]